jgi:hypothetical protein
MNQDIFDDIMGFALSIITSEDYLSQLDDEIYVSNVKFGAGLRKFGDDFNQNKLKPGLYPVAPGTDLENLHFRSKKEKEEYVESLGDAVHWYAVVKKGNKNFAYNGYPSESPFEIELDPKRAFGLNAQEEGSHGFCQSIALISYLGKQNILSKNKDDEARYKENMYIITDWLAKFTKENDFSWDLDDFQENGWLKDETVTFLMKRYKSIAKNQKIFLSTLFNFVNLSTMKGFLETWFTEDPDELSDDDELIDDADLDY